MINVDKDGDDDDNDVLNASRFKMEHRPSQGPGASSDRELNQRRKRIEETLPETKFTFTFCE